jgi:tyrosyl-tRNA synthetase
LTGKALVNGLARFTDQVFTLGELQARVSSGRQLRVKFGVDVTAPDLHVGHAVNLRVLRMFQEAGHKVIFLVGSFTTQIGDPTGKNAARPEISMDEIRRNAELFIKQAKMVLIDDPNLLEVRINSEWFDRMSAAELLRLMKLVTVAKLESRDMFRARVSRGEDIHAHELAYPLLQAWDSVVLEADVALCGSDQIFNETLGREFQRRHGQEPQIVLTTKIVKGLDGQNKQSKSLGNFVGLNDTARDKFGKVMTLPDELIIDWMLVHSDLPLDVVAEAERTLRDRPMHWKKVLAHAIVEMFHGTVVADAEQAWFEQTFQARQVPEDLPVIVVPGSPVNLFQVVREANDLSINQVRELFRGGAIRLNDQQITDSETPVDVKSGDILRTGRRKMYRIQLA